MTELEDGDGPRFYKIEDRVQDASKVVVLYIQKTQHFLIDVANNRNSDHESTKTGHAFLLGSLTLKTS